MCRVSFTIKVEFRRPHKSATPQPPLTMPLALVISGKLRHKICGNEIIKKSVMKSEIGSRK